MTELTTQTEMIDQLNLFKQRAQSYGGDLSLWPSEYIDASQQLLGEHPELQLQLDAEKELDDLLNQYSAETPKLSQLELNQMENRILKKTTMTKVELEKTLIDQVFEWLSPQTSIWRPAMVACIPILIGLSIGTNLEISDPYSLSDEIDLISNQYSLTNPTFEQIPQPISGSGGENSNEI